MLSNHFRRHFSRPSSAECARMRQLVWVAPTWVHCCPLSAKNWANKIIGYYFFGIIDEWLACFQWKFWIVRTHRTPISSCRWHLHTRTIDYYVLIRISDYSTYKYINYLIYDLISHEWSGVLNIVHTTIGSAIEINQHLWFHRGERW